MIVVRVTCNDDRLSEQTLSSLTKEFKLTAYGSSKNSAPTLDSFRSSKEVFTFAKRSNIEQQSSYIIKLGSVSDSEGDGINIEF